MAPDPGEEGLGRRQGVIRILDSLPMPRGARGIVLACGFAGVAALGVSALLMADQIGFAYLLIAALGYFFLQTRLVPAVLWLTSAAAGVLIANAGNPSGWIVCGLAALLAVVSLLPVPDSSRESSRKLEVQPDRNELSLPSANGHGAPPPGNAEVAFSNGDLQSHLQSPPLPNGTQFAAEEHLHRQSIKTIGHLRLEVDGEDAGKRLREQPRLEYLLSFLLARAVLGEITIDRSALADEIAPGITASSQRERLRKQLHALQIAMGSALKTILRTSNTHISLDLGEVNLDFRNLAEARARATRERGLVEPQLAEQIRRQLELTAGEFLADFSELEQEVTSGRGTAGQVVDSARTAIATWRADLALVLADHYEAIGRPQASIAYLRSALSECPDRQDIARLLASAYIQTGQTARAKEVRLEYQLSQEK